MEEKLFAALLAATPDADLVAVKAQADREVAPYRSKMPGTQIEQLQKQYVNKRLMEKYGLPRLSLFTCDLWCVQVCASTRSSFLFGLRMTSKTESVVHKFDVLILGAGAAGLMCAIEAGNGDGEWPCSKKRSALARKS